MKNIIDEIIDNENKLIFKIFAKYSGEKNIRKNITNVDWNYIVNKINYNNNNDNNSHTNIIDHINTKLPLEKIINHNDFDEYVINTIFKQTKKQLLINYLITNDIYTQFIFNVKQYPIFSNINNINEVIKQLKTDKIFQLAFHWRDTPQGYEFWKNICIKWENSIKQQIELITNNIMK